MVGKMYVVAGEPIFHSYSPHLFTLIHSYNDSKFSTSKPADRSYFFLETQALDANFSNKTDSFVKFSDDLIWHNFNQKDKIEISIFNQYKKNPKEDIHTYANLTSPLKHTTSEFKFENLDDSLTYSSVNCLAICENKTYSISTDGLAVVWLAMLAGLDIEESVLAISGGGGTARSAANAWINFGGKVNQISGHRTIPIPEENKTKNSADFLLLIDECEDFKPLKSDAVVLQASYNSEQQIPDNHMSLPGINLLVAQHLLCWYLLWNNDSDFKIPTFSDLLSNLENCIRDK